MQLREQTYVCTLAKYQNLTTSAKELNISSSALSLYVSNLEKKMGTRLFDRIGKRFALTYAGEVYVKTAAQMLDLKKNFDNMMCNIVENHYGKIDVGIQNFRSPSFAPQMICMFKQMYPNIEIRLKETSYHLATDMLLSGELDIYFGNCPSRQNSLEYFLIFKDIYLLIAAKDHPIGAGACSLANSPYSWINLNYLKNELIILPSTLTSSYEVVMEIFRENNFTPKNTTHIGKTETVLKLISMGHGLAFYPASFVKCVHLKNPVVLYSVGNSQKLTEFSAVWRKGREFSQCTSDLIQIVEDLAVTIK